MENRRKKMKASAITAAALLALTAQTVSAADAVGYNVVTVPANSDVLVSVPFNQKAVGSFAVVSVTGSGVTVADTIEANAYTNGYYVRFTGGSGEGLWSTISANGTGGFDLQNTAVLAHVGNGDTFKVYPHQTLAKVFPGGMADVAFEASANATVGARRTEVLLPSDAIGINKSSSATYYYINWNHPTLGLIKGWRLSGGTLTSDMGGVVIKPDSYMIVRNNGAEELTYISKGAVPSETIGMIVRTETSAYDLNFTSGRPVPVSLDDMGLEDVIEASANATVGARKDELLVFNNAAAGKNKSSAATYYYIHWNHPTLGLLKGWRLSGGTLTADMGHVTIDPSAGVIIRKAAGTVSVDVYAQNAPY